jgi:hypothetical protein
MQRVLQRRNSALMAILALANAAGNPNWFKGLWLAEVKPIGIGQRACMLNIAETSRAIER